MKKKFKILLAFCFLLSTSVAYSQMLVWGDMSINSSGHVLSEKQISITAGTTSAGILINEGNLKADGGISFQSQPLKTGMLHNSENGTVLYKTSNSNINLKKTGLAPGKWYYLSFPFRVKISDVLLANGGAGNASTIQSVYFREYNSQKRANSNSIDGSNWESLSADSYLEPLVGYAFAYSKNSNLTEVVFPIATDYNPNNTTEGINQPTKDITVENFKKVHAGGFVISEASGWNSKGSPYTSNYTLDQSSTGLTSGFVYQHCTVGGERYESMDLSSASNKMTITPFTMTFYKVANDTQTKVCFKQSCSTVTTTPVMRSESTNSNKEIIIELDDNKVRETIGYPDRCTLVMGEGYQESYSGEDDGPKMLAPSKEVSEIWLETKNSSLFVSKIPATNSNREINLGFNAGNASANYTIQVTGNNLDDTSIQLLDKKTGKQVNILGEKYSFSSTAGVDKSRFVLIVGSKAPTGIDNPDANSIQIYSKNGTIHVNNLASGDRIQVYDTVGKLLQSEVSTGNSASIQLATKGICIVRVTGSSQIVRKIYNN